MSHKLGRNDPCWCGSRLKYKRCHLGRERAQPVKRSDILTAFDKAFDKRYCLHPQAKSGNCQNNIVRAHTIQRNGGLSRIAKDGHVYNCLLHSEHLRPVSESLKPTLVGVNRASTFTGFCAFHDDAVFAPIEKQPFQSIAEHTFLLAYRAICHELFLKRADLELGAMYRNLDRGRSLEEQAFIQRYRNYHESGLGKALEELNELKVLCDDMLLKTHYSGVKYYVVRLKCSPEIMCSAVHQPEFDFRGNSIQDLGHLDRPAQWIHFSLIATDDGGAAVFSWFGGDICTRFIKSLDSFRDEEIPHAIVRYVFEFFENTYFSPPWWDSLSAATQRSLIRRQLTEMPPLFEYPRSNACLQDDGVRAVHWEVVSRDSNLDGWEG
jgi:hypothetical protein